MSVRALQARISCDRATLESLWRTHRVFNERLPTVLSVLFGMRRGELGETAEDRERMQAFAWGVLQLEAQNAYDPLIKAAQRSRSDATARNGLAGKADKARAELERQMALPDTERDSARIGEARSMVKRCEDYAAAFDLFQRGWLPLKAVKESLRDLPNHIERKLFEDACAHIRGHLALVDLWTQEHSAWLQRKKAWESAPEHQGYLSLRPRFEAFEEANKGTIGKRRGRWHLYLDWLRQTADLAAWRGGPAVVNELGAEARTRVAKAKPWKTRSVEAEEFWKINPELEALDRLHGEYERQFVRRRKRKRNPDGFDHRPTFTLPHAVRHPRWFVFNAPQTSPQGYRNLALPSKAGAPGMIELRLLTGEMEDGAYPCEWVAIQFRGDPRLAAFSRVVVKRVATKGKIKGEETTKEAFQFCDEHLGRQREAQISGAKLLFRDVRLEADGSLASATPYLVFTCTVTDIPFTEKAKQIQLTETGEVTRSGKKRKRRTLPPGLVSCAVDLGCRHLGFATLAVGAEAGPQVLRSRNLWIGREEPTGRNAGRWAKGADLAHLARHKREIRKLRRLRGRPVKGEASHVELQQHIDHMGEDRFKQAARAVINFALNAEGKVANQTGQPYPRADVLVLENLENLVPDAERERGINRALVQFNRGHLVQRIKEMAVDVGLKVIEVSPVGTSQVCSRCGALGRRYSLVRDRKTGKPVIQFGAVEKLFACPECGYRANADHNASVNLHRKLHAEEATSSYTTFRGLSQEARRARLAEIEQQLLRPTARRESLVAMHGLNPTDAPF